MNRFKFAFLILLILAHASCTGKGQQAAAPDDLPLVVDTPHAGVGIAPHVIPQGTFVKHIVVFKPGIPQQDRDSIAAGLTKSASHVYNTVFVGFAADISQSEFLSLTADSRIAYIEEDGLVQLCSPTLDSHPNDDPWDIRDDLAPTVFIEPASDPAPNFGDNAADWGVLRMNAFPAPGLEGAGVTVAIIDTGVDTDHPDLAGSLLAEYDAVNDVAGAGMAEDLHGHGTHVSGIVGARDNDIHTVGVAPLCSFAAIKVFAGSSGSGSDADLIRGIDWVAANQAVLDPPIKVINMSLSGTGTMRAMYDAVQACNDLGITTVVAAGNDFRDASQQMPANFDNVITVSAMRRVWNAGAYDYRFAMFSNWGNTVDLIAPGQGIRSLWNNGATRFASGTSMACPHVAGAVALYLDENLADGFEEVMAALVADGEAGTWTGDPDGVYEPLVDIYNPMWHTLTVDETGYTGQYSSLALVDGYPAISYYDQLNGELRYVRAMDIFGSTWGTPVTLNSADDVGLYTSLAIVDGFPAISYSDGTNNNLKFIRATDAQGSIWGTPVTLDSAGFVGGHTSLALVDGIPAISYYDSSNRDLKFVRAIDTQGSSWATPVTPDSADDVGLSTSLAVVDGNPAISYYDSTNDDLKFVRATDALGGSWGTPLAVDTVGQVGRYTSMALVDGYPAISYYDSTNDDLLFVRAMDIQGGSWATPGVLDTVGFVGQFTSLAVVDGNPAVSYNGNDHDLKYVRATDAQGASWATPQTLDSIGDVGWYTSLCVVNSSPAISYWDYSNHDLKYAYYGE